MNATVEKLNNMMPKVLNGSNSSSPKMNLGFANANGPKANLGLSNVLSPAKNNAAALNLGFSNAAAGNSGGNTKYGTPLMWFIGFLVIFLIIFAYYYEPFMRSIQNWTDSINMWFTGKGEPPAPPPPVVPTKPPVAPQDEDRDRQSGMDRVVENILPPAKEVFNISKNDYTYYDAAPLCKALGAELATYEDVKNAWQKGADWCNYGWVKGQMAVYPTQESTYAELQQGPEEQRAACGKPGLNGGFFDNPELRYGVTCVGKRPPQSNHDATSVTSGSTRPLTASGLEFEKKVQQFKVESDNLGIMPFNKEKWGS